MLCFIYQPHFDLLSRPVLSTESAGFGIGKRGDIKRTQQGTEQEEVGGGVAFDTHSTVWLVHVVVAPVLLDRHTERKKKKNKQQTCKEKKKY